MDAATDIEARKSKSFMIDDILGITKTRCDRQEAPDSTNKVTGKLRVLLCKFLTNHSKYNALLYCDEQFFFSQYYIIFLISRQHKQSFSSVHKQSF